MIASHAGVVLGVAHVAEAHRSIADFGMPVRRTSGGAVFDLKKMMAWIRDMPPFWRDEHDRNVFSLPDSHPVNNPYQPASGADADLQEEAA